MKRAILAAMLIGGQAVAQTATTFQPAQPILSANINAAFASKLDYQNKITALLFPSGSDDTAAINAAISTASFATVGGIVTHC